MASCSAALFNAQDGAHPPGSAKGCTPAHLYQSIVSSSWEPLSAAAGLPQATRLASLAEALGKSLHQGQS